MQNEALTPFYLVGGTALALQIGHRLSIDLDLFGNQELDELEINNILKEYVCDFQIVQKTKNILIYAADDIKIDFVNYPYPWLADPIIEESIRLASLEDIGAMKLNTISGRGSKKDFVDIYFLLKKYSLKELLAFYNKKYPNGSSFLVLKSLNYFEDAEQQEMPLMLVPVDWQEIKTKIIEQTLSIL
jgi:predicted nucleotidyltransferase component of viral defense system